MTDTTQTIDREAIRAEILATQKAYHDLLQSVPRQDWRKPSGNAGWSVGQLLYHMAWGQGFMPRFVDEARKESAFRPPDWIFNPINLLITRIGARRATPESLAEKYDAATDRLLAKLDEVRDGEWQRGVKNVAQFTTVEEAFHVPAQHFQEHEAQIRQGLSSC